MTAALSVAAAPGTNSPASHIPPDPMATTRRVVLSAGVSGVRHCTDAEREHAIVLLGQQMQAAYARYEASGCFSDLGEAHSKRMLMEALIRGRSASQVARMEAARGLN
jgi:hypothetical protein